MKGMYARYQQRQAKKIFPAAMEVYAETLNHLTQASGGGGVLRQDDRPLNIRLKPNEVYAVRALDRPDYYRTVMIKKNQMNGQFQMLISNPVYGTTPPGIDEVSQEQVFKQMREMNAQRQCLTKKDAAVFSDGLVLGSGAIELTHLRQRWTLRHL